MPTPYGSRGGVAFSADELRVLGGALAIALQSDPAPEEARDYLRLAEAVDETVREGHRLRSFLLADLTRYREALPGAAPGYLDQLESALGAGYLPRPDDLVALRTLCEEAAGERETDRRLALLHRCERLAERAVRARLRGFPHVSGATGAPGGPSVPAGRIPQHDETAPRHPAATAGGEPKRKPEPEPTRHPEPERGPDPERGPAPEPEPARKPQPDPEPAREPQPERGPGPERDSGGPGPAPKAAPESTPESTPDSAPGSAPGSEPDSAPGSDPVSEPRVGPPIRPVPTPGEVFPPRRGPAPAPDRETPESEKPEGAARNAAEPVTAAQETGEPAVPAEGRHPIPA